MGMLTLRVLCASTRRILSISHPVFRMTQISQIHDKAYVNGKWVTAKTNKTFDVFNPANEQLLASVPDMSDQDAEDAINSAHVAFQSWKELTGKERSVILRNWYGQVVAHKDEMAKLMTLENGKPVVSLKENLKLVNEVNENQVYVDFKKEALGEINYGADYIEFYSEEANRIHGEVLQSPNKSRQLLLVRSPIGVCGMLTPWNFPVAMIIRKVAAALAAGCTCVVKPAEDTPLSALMLAAMADKAGIPPVVFNVVTSSRQNTPEIGLKLCTSSKVAGISFTGSTAVGKLLYKQCAPGVKRLALELGGNAPFIVFESADLNKAVEGAVISKFRNSGQTCVSSNRIFVHQSVHDEFVSKLKHAMTGFVVGDGLSEKTTQGPLINKAQFEKVSSMIMSPPLWTARGF